eukprot:CAMPEP_0198210270 /NCGR_PEP_ID=MMETSP1445-20131203/20000_1 /TAXON_ID=36898 /ORGANISM="Pyramimonas sp., Strain CCMP2087" /LENGTH=348 /DNA_ID=CAMNT_0043884289 /DNA_START=102 /DNA_END=1148 /DNA_ORIENTATION=+
MAREVPNPIALQNLNRACATSSSNRVRPRRVPSHRSNVSASVASALSAPRGGGAFLAGGALHAQSSASKNTLGGRPTRLSISSSQEIPTFLNNTPHLRETRKFFYKDATDSVVRAVNAGGKRMQMRSEFPELNTEMDVYRIGTALEMIRGIVTELVQDGKKVKICVQGSMGQGVFQGLPLSLAGVRRIMEAMDWGEDMLGNFINLGEVGPEHVLPSDDVVIVYSPTSIVGSSIIPPLAAMCETIGDRPVILFNPRLTDVQSAEGIMGVRGRQERLDFEATFETVYHFRLLYNKPYHFPIYGALRKSYGKEWEVYKRKSISKKEEVYTITPVTYKKEPNADQITKSIRG